MPIAKLVQLTFVLTCLKLSKFVFHQFLTIMALADTFTAAKASAVLWFGTSVNAAACVLPAKFVVSMAETAELAKVCYNGNWVRFKSLNWKPSAADGKRAFCGTVPSGKHAQEMINKGSQVSDVICFYVPGDFTEKDSLKLPEGWSCACKQQLWSLTTPFESFGYLWVAVNKQQCERQLLEFICEMPQQAKLPVLSPDNVYSGLRPIPESEPILDDEDFEGLKSASVIYNVVTGTNKRRKVTAQVPLPSKGRKVIACCAKWETPRMMSPQDFLILFGYAQGIVNTHLLSESLQLQLLSQSVPLEMGSRMVSSALRALCL